MLVPSTYFPHPPTVGNRIACHNFFHLTELGSSKRRPLDYRAASVVGLKLGRYYAKGTIASDFAYNVSKKDFFSKIIQSA